MSPHKLNGWEVLICPYFAETCRRVLWKYLEKNGFAEKGCDEIGAMTFSRFDVFLEISYELDMAPNYGISIVLGTGEKKYDEIGHPYFIPYWKILPPDRPEHRGQNIYFKSEEELERLLVDYRNQFLEPYAKPLWLDIDRLEKTINHFRAEWRNLRG